MLILILVFGTDADARIALTCRILDTLRYPQVIVEVAYSESCPAPYFERATHHMWTECPALEPETVLLYHSVRHMIDRIPEIVKRPGRESVIIISRDNCRILASYICEAADLVCFSDAPAATTYYHDHSFETSSWSAHMTIPWFIYSAGVIFGTGLVATTTDKFPAVFLDHYAGDKFLALLIAVADGFLQGSRVAARQTTVSPDSTVSLRFMQIVSRLHYDVLLQVVPILLRQCHGRGCPKFNAAAFLEILE